MWSTDPTTGYGPEDGGREPWSRSFGPLSPFGNGDDQAYFSVTLLKWSNVAKLTFNLVQDTASSVGDIRAAYTYPTGHPLNTIAWAYFPSDTAKAGDMWFSKINVSATDYWTPGTLANFTVLHELGHALGLKHPFESAGSIGTVLSDSQDTQSFTIMSYSAKPGDSNTKFSFYPTTPMIFDIAAIQNVYGANYSFHAGNDNYQFDDGTYYHQTIWDGGGIDTIQYNGVRDARIDLRAGYGSSIGLPVNVETLSENFLNRVKNVWIAYDATIENASGGNGNDQIIGNDANNVLSGAAGNDSLDGGAGIDTAVFSGKSTEYYLVKNAASLLVIPHTVGTRLKEGTDTLENIEQVWFAGDGTTKAASGIDYQTFGLKYIASNRDLINAFGVNADAGVAHYIQFGMNEGRTVTFDGLTYIASNRDLINAFGVNADAGVAHYIQFGMNEGRTVIFDGLTYIASNRDLINAFGVNADAGVAHYIQFGMNEGRTSTFDANFYLAKNGDLRAAFGTNLTAATQHYILSGSREGRSMITSGNDTLSGSSSADVINGYSGDDNINGFGGNDTLYGGAGNDTFDYDVNARAGNDTFIGGTENDTYVLDSTLDSVIEYSGEGTDTIWVSFSYSIANLPYVENLRVYGSSGVTLIGNAGGNLLTGNKGNDVFAGGAGADIYFFATSEGVDRITDFSISQGDRIQIASGTNGITTSTQALAHVYTDVYGNGAIDLGNGNSVILTGVPAASLHASDFLIS
jgi:serralysin